MCRKLLDQPVSLRRVCKCRLRDNLNHFSSQEPERPNRAIVTNRYSTLKKLDFGQKKGTCHVNVALESAEYKRSLLMIDHLVSSSRLCESHRCVCVCVYGVH